MVGGAPDRENEHVFTNHQFRSSAAPLSGGGSIMVPETARFQGNECFVTVR
jgi:hypothetical protein